MIKFASFSSFRKNITFSIAAQVLSLIVSVVLGLIVPKAIPQLQYAYWQTYLLYASYVGILHFGLLDGIVLRYSQYDYEELELPRVKSQFQFLLLINSLCAFLLLILANHLWHGVDQTIAILVAFSIIVKNVHTYTSFIFQITNRIKYYASLTILAPWYLFGYHSRSVILQKHLLCRVLFSGYRGRYLGRFAHDALIYRDQESFIYYRQHGNNVIGGRPGFIKRIKLRLNMAVTNPRVRSQMVQELLKGYSAQMNADSLRICKKIANYKKT